MTYLKLLSLLLTLLVSSSVALATHNSIESLHARIAPVGSINFGDSQAGGKTMANMNESAMDGPTVYASSCGTCHETGVAGAPITGNADDWAGRLDKGMEVLVQHAINGFQGSKGVMPAKGGNSNLSDEEVAESVEYMIGLLEASDSESLSKSTASAAGQTEASTTMASNEAIQNMDYVLDLAIAQQTHANYCAVCHQAGVAGAPTTGDQSAWEPRLAQGIEVLVNHAINGFQGNAGVMPAKGGFANLSDEEVAQAVYYMVEQIK